MDARTLESRLAAAQKTIAALMRRVEDDVAGGQSAFAVLERSVALERVVADKTREVEAQRRELQEALDHLRKAQSDLLQAQKLESVGRLASGIAHEINTPIQFVTDSISFVQTAFSDLLPLIEAYRRLRHAAASGSVTRELVASIEAAEATADLDYLMANAPLALERCLGGLGRVAALVVSMREFAHPQLQRAAADINRAVSGTLTIARNEYQDVAEVKIDLGELPQVSCYLGALNQVFLNIIVNASHAIAAARGDSDQRGELRVQTRREDDWVRISISDTGTGIPEAVRDRIFDPFFTTKEVGKGTGQGLSIAHSVVVSQHRGTLTFDSELGRGTTFHIRLPIEGA